MIQEFVSRFESAKEKLAATIQKTKPGDYESLVKLVVEAIKGDEYDAPDPSRIHKIDDGHYQGTLVFVIAAQGYQPSTYWYVKVGYGSCSGCDTLESIVGYSDEPLSDAQVKDYMTLLLHIVQGIKLMGDD